MKHMLGTEKKPLRGCAGFGGSVYAPFSVGGLLGVLLLIAASLASPLAQAQDTVCAHVKIEIKQELTLERQAFDARMAINNTTDSGVIENVSVVVKVADENGTPVAVTSDPSDLSAKFFLRVSDKQNISDVDGSGTVNPQTSATIDWLLIPAPGSAGATPLGKKYLVGATLTYTFNGERTVLEVSPDVITVKPLPSLTLDYFLPRDVNADDPLTPEIEPAEPFTLGLRVKNTGQADAKSLKIDSAQPKITDNQQGLLINFVLTGSYVDDAPAQNTLLIGFGDIAAGTSKMGRWNMETTLSGKFTEFTARFSHGDELGGALTSVMQATNTHTLIHDVRVDLPGRDTVHDFLAQDNDAVRVYESDGPDSEVADRSSTATLTIGAAASGNPRYHLGFPATPGFAYVKLPDPFNGQKVLGSVLRLDAKRLASQNVWLSKTRDAQTKQWQYWVNVFDVNTPGAYDAEFQDPPPTTHPPVLQAIADQTVQETQQVSFVVEASSPDNKPVTISAAPLPVGATLTPQASDPGAPGVARAIFDWTPPQAAAGVYSITYTANDGVSSVTRTAKITVQTAMLGKTPPEVNNDSATTRKGVNVTLVILANDSLGAGVAGFDLASLDLDPATPAVDATRTVPGEGSFTVNAAGTVSFAPLPSFTGVSSIAYRIKDGLGQPSNLATVTVTVTGPGNPTGVFVTAQPVANPDVGKAPLNTAVSLDLKLNDVASLGETLDSATLDLDTCMAGVQADRIALEGVWHANGDGTVTFTPALGFAGSAALPYAIADSAGKTAQSTVTVTVSGGSAPLAQNDSGATWPTTPTTLAILDNDSPGAGAYRVPYLIDLDPSTPAQMDSVAVTAEGAWAANSDGTVTFTPTADYKHDGKPFTGTATLPYRMADSNGQGAAATITVAVNPTQAVGAPIAANDNTGTPFNTPTTLAPAGNDSASAGATLNPTTLDLDPATAALERSQTTAEGVWQVEADGTVSFTPSAVFTGTTLAQPYRIRDSLGNYADAALSVTVSPPSGLTLGGTVFHDLDQSQIQNGGEPGTNAGGLYVTALNASQQAVATAPVSADGTYSLPVAANTAYTLVLSTTANGATANLPGGWSSTGENADGTADGNADGRLGVNVGVASLTGRNFGILGAAPVANDDRTATPHDTPVAVAILANDSQGPGGTRFDPATVDLDLTTDGIQASFAAPGEGAYAVDPTTGSVSFDPLPTFSGVATPLRYAVKDDLGRTARPATITVAVGPDAANDSADTLYQTPLNGNVAGNDRYPSGAVFTQGMAPPHGTLTNFNAATGTYTYTPATGYSGSDSFSYRLCLPVPDDILCDTASVSLAVAAQVIPPELRIEAKASSGQPAVGLPFFYTLTVTNSGGSATGPVRMIDTVPAGARLVGVNVPVGWTCTPAVSPLQPLQGGNGATLTCDFAGTLAAGQQTLALTAVPTAAMGSYANLATITGDGQTPNATNCDGSAQANCGQASITPTNPRLELAQKVALSPTDETGAPDGRAQAGEKLTHSFTLTNRGDVALSPVALADAQLDGGSLGCAATTALGNVFGLTGANNALAANDSVSCTGWHTVTAAEEAAGRAEDTATATGKAADGTPWQSTANGAWDNAPSAGQISLFETARHNDADGDGKFDQGETVSRSFIIRNVGNMALVSLAVSGSDPLFAPVNCPPAVLLAGAQAVCTTADMVLALADETAGQVVNTATATGMDPNGHAIAANTTRVLDGGQAAGLELKQGAVPGADLGMPGLSAGDTLAYTLVAANTGGLALTNVTLTGSKLGAALQVAGACSPAQGSTLNPGDAMVCTATYTIQAGEADPIDNAVHATGKPLGRNALVDASSHLAVPYVQATGPSLYTVGNRVWLDNDNGIMEAAETGIDGVVVRLQIGNGAVWTQANYADNSLIPDQVTAGGGYYQFANVPQNGTDQRYRVAIVLLNFKSDLSGTKPLYGAVSSYIDDGSAFPWIDGRDQGVGTSADAANGTLSRAFDLASLPTGTTAFNSVDFGFVKAKITAPPDLVITNTASTAAVNRNGTFTYTLQASNAVGSGSLTRAPIIIDTLPTGVTVSGTAATLAASNWSCAVSSSRQIVTCTFKGTLPLAGGADLGGAVVIPVDVGSTVATGVVTNTATITKMGGEPSFANNAASATVNVMP